MITANKAFISKYGYVILSLAENNRMYLEYEAAVCGGVPIIRSTIVRTYVDIKINRFNGIFNGTSNYILSSMDKDKTSFNDTLNPI